MKTVWRKGLNEQEAAEVASSFVASANIRKRLRHILEEKIETKRRETISDDAYKLPSWALYQADAIGYERAMNEIISLISSESVEK